MSEQHPPSLRLPSATYRLQLNRDLGFASASRLVPYLDALGITDLYASPLFKARPGSGHGYDIVDHHQLNPELGEAADYDRLCARLRERGMGQILDIVPNHMCVESPENAWWMDVLENGPSSPYAEVFDIDWQPVKGELANKVLLPVLGDQYGAVLENGELALVFQEGAFFLHYWQHRFPIIPKTYVQILSLDLPGLTAALGEDHPDLQEYESIITALRNLPLYTERDPERVAERYREKEVVKRRLWRLWQEGPAVRSHIDASVVRMNGSPGDPVSFDLLDALLREQVYRLSHWQVAMEEINYRRFFDINALAAIRVERPQVFADTHRLVLSLMREGRVTGLRVDHADGLYDPAAYLQRLQEECALAAGPLPPPVDSPEPAAERSCYVVGEKILTKGERLPADWPIFGETGYGFLNALTGIFVDSRQAKAFDRIYRRFTGSELSFAESAVAGKKLVMQVSMAAEVNTLGHYLNVLSEINRHTRDFTLPSQIKALVEVIAHFPVYRTYINSLAVSDRDRGYIEQAVARARRRNPALNASIFEFIRDVLLLRFPPGISDEERRRWLDFVMRFQQVTGPVMAKGVEDTACYVANRLTCLNEVGGDPERFGLSLEAFHGQNIERSRGERHGMLATTTHDSKRGEDVRVRIAALTEIPEAWREAVGRWSRLNRRHKRAVEGGLAPDRNEEYLLYQTLVGAWPLEPQDRQGQQVFTARIQGYMEKAVREAKVNSSWISPHRGHEEAVAAFVAAILDPVRASRFLAGLQRFLAPVAEAGMAYGLSQALVKIASPGVPDLYQGTELWYLRLVDPDNRQPVDFELRMGMLADLEQREREIGTTALAEELVASRRDGRIKLFLVARALRFRRQERALFQEGAYLPLKAAGTGAESVVAFARALGESLALVVAPRLVMGMLAPGPGPPLGSAWGDTAVLLPEGTAAASFHNLFTGEIVAAGQRQGRAALPLAEVLGRFPVALLASLP
ncbi:MAG: malto-oligosyltrehalose synthase [Thermodesulfobacteriota bacterium]